MVNNAARSGPNAPFAELRLDEWSDAVANLLGGVFLGTKHAARVMTAQGSGSIISTSSTAGSLGGLGPHCYTACKHAVVGLVKSAAGEFAADGILVNAVSPGKVVSQMTALGLIGDATDFAGVEALIAKHSPLGIAGQPIDIANAALYLASEESRYVTGHNLRVDSGTSVLGPNAQIYRMNA